MIILARRACFILSATLAFCFPWLFFIANTSAWHGESGHAAYGEDYYHQQMWTSHILVIAAIATAIVATIFLIVGVYLGKKRNG